MLLFSSVKAWLSVPVGVVSLAERFPEETLGAAASFRGMVDLMTAQIAAFSGDPATAELYRGVAGLYRRMTADVAGANADTAALKEFLKRAAD